MASPAGNCADLGARHPALATLADAITALGDDNASLPALQRCLSAACVRNARGIPLSVRDERVLRGDGRGYEERILGTGVVSVRSGSWHDLFNVLVWRTFPCAKAALNERHCAAFEHRPDVLRGPLRDALTLFDESGVIVVASKASLLDALRSFQWKTLFWSRRAELARCLRVHVFGHAVYEKLLDPYVGLTGHAALFHVQQTLIDSALAKRNAALDRSLAAFLRERTASWSPQDLHPVPLLGVPGWHPDTADERFYENRDYFRPGRRQQRSAAPCGGERG